MAPVNAIGANQATRDRKNRLRVRNGPGSQSPNRANDIRIDRKDGQDKVAEYTVEPDRVFTINIDGERAFSNVKKSVLKKSRVLGAMCNGQYTEGQTTVIELKDDDVTHFKNLLEYLVAPARGVPKDMKRSGDYPELLVGLYILADKYRVAELHEEIVQALINFYLDHETFDTRTGIRFFSLGETVYGSVGGINDPFRTWFRPMVPIVLKFATNNMMDYVYDIVAEGGELAVDISRGQAEAFKISAEIVKKIRLAIGSGYY